MDSNRCRHWAQRRRDSPFHLDEKHQACGTSEIDYIEPSEARASAKVLRMEALDMRICVALPRSSRFQKDKGRRRQPKEVVTMLHSESDLERPGSECSPTGFLWISLAVECAKLTD